MDKDKQRLAEQNEKILFYEKELQALKTSLSYRLGFFMTAPLRWAYDLFARLFPLVKQQIFSENSAGIHAKSPTQKSLTLTEKDISDFHLLIPETPAPSPHKTVLVYLPFMAIGGAEHLLLNVIKCLPDIRWVLVSTLPCDPSLGNMEAAFRKITPHVFDAAKALAPDQHILFIEYLIQQFNPSLCYISNGAELIYDYLPLLKQMHPDLRFANQVYDYQAGWINRYATDPHMSSEIDLHIGTNPLICQAYLKGGVPLGNIQLIEHCIDTELFSPAHFDTAQKRELKQALGLPLDKKIIAFMGRLHPQKRPIDFVELARRMENRKDVFFYIVGDGEMAAVVDDQLAHLSLPNIKRRGFYRPAQEMLAIIDVLVLPSAYEGMPLVIMEAQAMGKAVVATTVGNNEAFLADTGGGITVSVGEIGSLMAAVEEVLAHPIDAAEVRNKVVNRVDCQVIAQQYANAFFDLEPTLSTK